MHYRATRKNLESKTQLQLNALLEAIHYSFLKFRIYCFSFWYVLFVHYALRVEKNDQHVLDAGPLEFQFLRPWRCLTNPFRILSLCFGTTDKTQGLISSTNFVNKFLSASAITIMSWQDVTRSSLYSGVKECGTKRANKFLFPKLSFRIRRTIVLGMFKDSAIILDVIRRSFLSRLATAAMFTSVRVDFRRSSLSSSSTS